jgi:hypothetical protein
MASLLPNAKSQFLDGDGHPLAGGSIAFYVPGTTTASPTWQDAAATIPNTNPITLDGSGMAVIYGSGAYRSVLMDSAGNQVWDADTAELTSLSGLAVAGSITASSITTTGDGTFANVTAGGTVSGSFISTSGTVQAGFVNSITINADALSVFGDTTITNALNVSGAMALAGGLNVNGFITSTGGITTVAGALTVTGDENLAGNLAVNNINAVAVISSAAMTVSGALGAGTISVAGTFAGSTSGWQLSPTGTSAFSGSFNLGIASGGGVLGTTFIASSDARVKTEIENVSLDDALRFARAMRAKVFMKDGSPDAGFIAQHAIANDFHRMVVTSETDDPRMAAGDDLSPIGRQLNLNYNHAIAYHHRMIEYLLDRIDDLEERLVSAR